MHTLQVEDAAEQEKAVAAAHEKHAAGAYNLAKSHGGIYCKAAQFVSSLQGGAGDKGIPSQYLAALAVLTDQAKSQAFENVAVCIKEDNGKDWSDFFSEVNKKAIAAGSLAQVHEATLKIGSKKVALKLQYPNLRTEMASDFAVFQQLGAQIQPGGYDLRWLANDIEKFITKELDFTIEANNSETARLLLAHRGNVVVPAVDKSLLSTRVLCTDFIPGLERFDGTKVTKEQEGYSRSVLGTTVAEVFAELMLQHGVVHGDPHAGNVYAASGNRVVVLDHGLHHHLSEEDRTHLCHLVRACILGCSTSTVQKHAQHFAGVLWRLFPLVINPAFAFAVPSSLKDIQAANAARLPDDISLEDVWKTMISMQESESDVLGALHSLGYVRGLLNTLGFSEKGRVLCLGRAATYGIYDKGLWPGASEADAARVGLLGWLSLQASLVMMWVRVELLFFLLMFLSPLVGLYLSLFGAGKAEAETEDNADKLIRAKTV